MTNVKARFRNASLSEAVKIVGKKRRNKNPFMATARMFRGAKKLWEGDEYERAVSPREKGIRNKMAKPKVTLPAVQFTKRRLDGET